MLSAVTPLRLGGSASEVFTQNIAAELVRCLQAQFATAEPTKSLPAGGEASTPSAPEVPASTEPSSSVRKEAGDHQETKDKLDESENGKGKAPSEVGVVGTPGVARPSPEEEKPDDVDTVPGTPHQLTKNDIKNMDEGYLHVIHIFGLLEVAFCINLLSF